MVRLLLLLVALHAAYGQTETHFDWIRRLGSGQDSFVSLGTDSKGNIYVVGNTRAPDFPCSLSGGTDVFLIQLDSAGNTISTACFGGSGEDVASSAAVDPSGSVYVTGLTFSPDFPTTSGSFRSVLPGAGPLGARGASFVFKRNPDGTTAYSTFVATAESTPKGIAVDSAGSVYIAGPTVGNLPVTDGAYRSECNCALTSNGFFSVVTVDGFLARLDPTGSKLLFATYLGVNALAGGSFPTPLAIGSDGRAFVGTSFGVFELNAAGTALLDQAATSIRVQALALTQEGSLFAAGTALRDFQPTSGAAQTDRNTFPPLDYQLRIDEQTAVVKLDRDLRTVAATYFGGPYGSAIASLAIDATGNLIAAGTSPPHGLPTIAPLAQGFGSPGTGFAAKFSPDLSAVLFASYFGDAENFLLQGLASASDGSVVLGGATANPQINASPGTVWINKVIVSSSKPLRIDSVVNAASRIDDPISGGETVVVRGDGFDRESRLRFGDVEVTPTSVTQREITAVVPLGLSGDGIVVSIRSGGLASNSVLVSVGPASPGLFSTDMTGRGQGLILNEDGSLSSSDHPARPGDRITILATGVGSVSFDQGYAVTADPVSVYVDGFYCRGVAARMGPVDGLPADVYQLTVNVPTYAEVLATNPDLRTFQFPAQAGIILRIAGHSSQNGLAISIAP